jgi:hypothetical protein
MLQHVFSPFDDKMRHSIQIAKKKDPASLPCVAGRPGMSQPGVGCAVIKAGRISKSNNYQIKK